LAIEADSNSRTGPSSLGTRVRMA